MSCAFLSPWVSALLWLEHPTQGLRFAATRPQGGAPAVVSSLSEGLGHSPTAHAGCTGERAPPPRPHLKHSPTLVPTRAAGHAWPRPRKRHPGKLSAHDGELAPGRVRRQLDTCETSREGGPGSTEGEPPGDMSPSSCTQGRTAGFTEQADFTFRQGQTHLAEPHKASTLPWPLHSGR